MQGAALARFLSVAERFKFSTTTLVIFPAVPSTLPLFKRRSLRLALMCLVAVVVCLQGIAIGVFTTLGPAHFHRALNNQASDTVQVLEDVRRWRPVVEQPSTLSTLSTLFGHSHHDAHGSGGLQRHYHAVGDASVVKVGNDLGLNAAEVDEGLGASVLLAACWAASTTVLAWQPIGTADVPASRPGWVPMGVVVEPLDRPPKVS